MTSATTTTAPTTEAETPDGPADVLMYLIVSFLAPMFLGVTSGNIRIARMAAIETINAYRAQSLSDLVAIAQIIGFGFAALGSLSLSMADDITLAMTLRLRGNANALNRSAEQNRRVIRESQARQTMPHQIITQDAPWDAVRDPATDAAAPQRETPVAVEDHPTQPETDMFLSQAAARQLAAEANARLQSSTEQARATPPSAVVDRQNQAIWAAEMVKEASKISASIPHLPPSERAFAAIRVDALNNAAKRLLTGAPAAPAPRAQTQGPLGTPPSN